MIYLIWNLTVFIGCSYLVFWKGHSGAWFILAILIGTWGEK